MSVANVDNQSHDLLETQINFYMCLSQYTPISDRGSTLGSQLFDNIGIGVLENMIRLCNPALNLSEDAIEASIVKQMNAQQQLVKQKYNDMLTILRKLRSKFGKTHSLYEIGTKLYQAVTSFVTQIRSLYLTGQLGNEDKEGASQIEIAEAILAYAILMHVLKQRPDFYKPMWQLSNETIATIGGFKTTELWIWSMISRFDETGIEYFDKCVVNLTNMYCAKYGHNPVAKEMSISDMSGILFQYIEKAKQEAAYLEQLNSAMFTEMLETLYSIPASERINNEINKMLGIQILRTR